MTFLATLLILTLSQAFCWEALPSIPSGHRSQFLVLHENGGYKYGYDTGDGNAAKQSGDASNQVSGHYFYKNSLGQDVDLKYTAGVQGFVPEGVEKLLPTPGVPLVQSYSAPVVPVVPFLPAVSQYSSSDDSHDDQAGTGDASYSFNIDTDTYKRQENSDARGNVKGSYSYSNAAGTHDISYVAGENTGFVATSGSLAKANGLTESQQAYVPHTYLPPSLPAQGYSYPAPSGSDSSVNQENTDGSYAFAYSTGDSSRQESADAGNNVQGRYSYTNQAGNHDLSYVAGAATGFLVTGGSLSKPNGLVGSGPVPAVSSYSAPLPVAAVAVPTPYSSSVSSSQPSSDGSYSFGYSAGDSSRQESSDASGNVKGSYSYRNGAGSHDLSYVAGSSTGFLVTGGSLAAPNGLGDASGQYPSTYSAVPLPVHPISYSGVSVSDDADSHDDQSDTGDSSYSFTVDTDDYKRVESSDAKGNVQGSFSYKNAAGSHDLSYVAGSATGFLPTGGSLSDPNAITQKIASLPYAKSVVSPVVPVSSFGYSAGEGATDEQSSGDASYNFSFDTPEYKRTEASDASGNVQGSFSYTNSVGNNDLSFVAGSATGFLPTGGSLKTAPGLSESQLRSGQATSYSAHSSASHVVSPVVQSYSVHSVSPAVVPVLPATKTSYKLGNVVVHSYLPPANEKKKYGYILDSA